MAGIAQGPGEWGEVLYHLKKIGRGPHEPPVFGLLATVAPEQTRAWLQTGLQAAYANLPEPLPAAERVRQLADVDKQIAKVEREAAEAWWTADADGLSLPLPDVGAAAMLGIDEA